MTHLHTATDGRVFVFGSNRLGIHGAGAARYARDQLGAVTGVGEGRTGRAYALPTCSAPGVPLTIDEIKAHVDQFLSYAYTIEEEDVLAIGRVSVRFFVSTVGCGLAGFREETIAPLFATAPSNCDLPPRWRR
jgi:hypothetical protein